ncbi:uncharacterized protein [Antedon mediterranea]|uniref:uncharacterized protein isoform X2 n=1 Tax=Antedon mediterranea TaxID=105859 RepID=UPI003AF738DF
MMRLQIRLLFLYLLVVIHIDISYCCCSGGGRQTEWPELVGETGDVARSQILNDYPNLKVYIIPADSAVTADFVTNRVRIFVDQENIVTRPPRIG